MQFELIRNLPEMNALAVEWNELLAVSASHVPFLRNDYLSTWWQTMGGGECRKASLCVITPAGGKLVGMPRFLHHQPRWRTSVDASGLHRNIDLPGLDRTRRKPCTLRRWVVRNPG